MTKYLAFLPGARSKKPEYVEPAENWSACKPGHQVVATVTNADHAGAIRSFSEYRNDMNIAAWGIRMALTGGADLQDLRNAAQLDAWTSTNRYRWRMDAFLLHLRPTFEARRRMQQKRLKAAERRAVELFNQ